jgi:hypothetical protein
LRRSRLWIDHNLHKSFPNQKKINAALLFSSSLNRWHIDMESSSSTWDATQPEMSTSILVNGDRSNGYHEPTMEELERELPMVYDGQVPLGDVLSRVVQAIYAELSELAET